MKKLFLSLLLCITLINIAFSQSEFRDGYIINLNGDTIYGSISFDNSKNTPLSCLFKTKYNSELQSYSSSMIKAFCYHNGKYYVSKLFIMNNKKYISFVEYLYHGKIDLYQLTINNIDYYLIEKENEIPILMRNDDINSSLTNDVEEENSSIITVKQVDKNAKQSFDYRDKLKKILSDCPEIVPQIENTAYNPKSIVKTLNLYQQKEYPNQQTINYLKLNAQYSYEFTPVFAVTCRNSVIPINANYTVKSLKTNFSPYLGIGINVKNNWIKYNNITLQYYGIVGYEHIDAASEIKYGTQYTLDRKSLLFNNSIGLSYNINIKSVITFASVGINGSYGIILDEKNDLPYTFRGNITAGKISYGVFGSVGIKFKLTQRNFEKISIRYENYQMGESLNYFSIKQKGPGLYFETTF